MSEVTRRGFMGGLLALGAAAATSKAAAQMSTEPPTEPPVQMPPEPIDDSPAHNPILDGIGNLEGYREVRMRTGLPKVAWRRL